MNYYPFHLGDYAAHTAHLEPMEDLAYRRMLDVYYRGEKALPADVSEIARLTRLRDQAATIRDVLNEFFVLADDGWHSKRADDELTEMKAKQEQQATKDEHEAERLRRHRARRAEMFEALRAVGVVPAWDVAIKELQRLFDTHCNAPETSTGPLPATDSQRLSLPTPTPKENTARKRAPAAPVVTVESLCLDGLTADVAAEYLAHRKRKRANLTPKAWEAIKAEIRKAGLSLDDGITKALARGWTGFEADWLAKDTKGYQKPDIHSTVAVNPGIEATQRLLRRQAEAAANATPPPAAILALRSRHAS